MATVTYNGFVVWVNRCVITPQAAPGVDCARVKLALRLLGRRAETLFNEVVGVVDIPQRPAPPVAPPRIAPVSSAEGADPHWRGAGPVLSRIRAHLQEDPEFEKSFPGGFREILVDILIQGVREERFPPAEGQPLGTVAFPYQVQDVMNGIWDRVAGVSWGDKSAIHMLRQAVAYAWRVYVDRVLGCIEAFIRWHVAVSGALSLSSHPWRVVKLLVDNVEAEGERLRIPLEVNAHGRVVFPWNLLLPRLGAEKTADPGDALRAFWPTVAPFPSGDKPRFEVVRVEPSGLGSTESRQIREFLPLYQALAAAVQDDTLGDGALPISAGEAAAHLRQRVAVLARPTVDGDGLMYTDGIRTWTARPAPREAPVHLSSTPGAKRSRFAPPEPEPPLEPPLPRPPLRVFSRGDVEPASAGGQPYAEGFSWASVDGPRTIEMYATCPGVSDATHALVRTGRSDAYDLIDPSDLDATIRRDEWEVQQADAASRKESGFWDDADVIARYSRADMLADGSLVDVETVDGERPFLEAGVRFPVAMTRASYQKMIAMPAREPVYDRNTPTNDIIDEGMPRIEAGLQRLLPDPAHVQAAWAVYGHALIAGWAAQRGLKSEHLGQMWRDSRAPRLPEAFPWEQVQHVTTEDDARRLLSAALPGERFTLTAKKTYSTWDAELRVGDQRFGATMEKTRKVALQNLLTSFSLTRWIWTQRLAPYIRTEQDALGKLKAITARATPAKPTAAERAGNDMRGRAWDVATMLARAVKDAPHTNRVTFTVYAVTDRITPGPVQLQAVIGPGDDGEPVITVGLADEDLS